MSYKLNTQFPASRIIADIASLESDSFHKARTKFEDCRKLLESFGVSQGPVFLWEFHLVTSLLIWAMLIAVTVVAFTFSDQFNLFSNFLLSKVVSMIKLEPVTGIFLPIIVGLRNLLLGVPLTLAIFFPVLKCIGLASLALPIFVNIMGGGILVSSLIPSILILNIFLEGSIAEVCGEFRGPSTALMLRLFPDITQQPSENEEAQSRLVEVLYRRAVVNGANLVISTGKLHQTRFLRSFKKLMICQWFL
jgi:hypothetical protein